jgi:uncharacterized membrane protein YqhA
VKLATALIGISSIHLLKTFIAVAPDPEREAEKHPEKSRPVAAAYEPHSAPPPPPLSPPVDSPAHGTSAVTAAIMPGDASQVVAAIEAKGGALPDRVILWQVIIHMVFIISAFMLAWTDRITTKTSMEVAHK